MKKRYSRTLLIATAALAVTSTQALANPNGGSVVAGQATIAQTAPAQVTITQSTDKAIINWNSFSIGSGEQTRFVQPSNNSITLNRVTGPDVSQILGQLTANGRIVLVNPNGVFFGKDSQVDVAALIATNHDIKNDDFMAGKLNFTIPGKPGAQIINQGKITVQEGGLVALVAPSVQNSGLITARLGKVTLASANSFTIDLYGDNLILFEADSAITSQLKDALGNPLSAAVENSGTIEANGGWVLLTAEVAKNVVDKAINMTGHIKATTVDQQEGAIILKAMGGEVAVAGSLDASAPNGGDGGFVETSGAHVSIDPSTKITTAAPFGKTGRWLIDPADYTIAASGGNMTGAALAGYLATTAVEVQTDASGNGGNGDIFVNDSVTWNTANELIFSAYRNIYVNQAINANGGASVKLRADGLGTGTGYVAFGGSGHITVNNATVGIYYNPASYTDAATRSDTGGNPYSGKVTLNGGSSLETFMLVNDVNQLQSMNTNLSGNYALGNDIDATATVGWNGGAGFDPLGDWGGGFSDTMIYFSGKFNGLGHSISNLYINRPTEDGVGLFVTAHDLTFQQNNVSISNLTLLNSSIVGQDYVGGVLAQLWYANISNVSSVGSNVQGRNFVGGLVGSQGACANATNVTNIGIVSGNDIVGGIAGYLYSFTNIDRAVSSGLVSGHNAVGGLAGKVRNGAISDSYNSANVVGNDQVGGVAGETEEQSYLTNIFNSGGVTGATNVGGLLGKDWATAIIASSYWDTQTSGQATSAGGIGLTTAQMKQQASYAGWDFTNTWQIVEGVSRPTIRAAASNPAPVVLTPGGNPPAVNPFSGLSASALYAAVINANLANSYSNDADWLDLKASNGGNATQAQIDANIMLNAYNRYKAYSGQNLAYCLFWDVINHFSINGVIITNDSANLLWQGSKGSSLMAGVGQISANIMLNTYNTYKTADGPTLLAGIYANKFKNDPTDPIWMAMYVNGSPSAAQLMANILWEIDQSTIAYTNAIVAQAGADAANANADAIAKAIADAQARLDAAKKKLEENNDGGKLPPGQNNPITQRSENSNTTFFGITGEILGLKQSYGYLIDGTKEAWRADGSVDLEFPVYNNRSLYVAVEILDKDGNVVGTELVEPKLLNTSAVDYWKEQVGGALGDESGFKDSRISSKTDISVNVPAGGSVRMSYGADQALMANCWGQIIDCLASYIPTPVGKSQDVMQRQFKTLIAEMAKGPIVDMTKAFARGELTFSNFLTKLSDTLGGDSPASKQLGNAFSAIFPMLGEGNKALQNGLVSISKKTTLSSWNTVAELSSRALNASDAVLAIQQDQSAFNGTMTPRHP